MGRRILLEDEAKAWLGRAGMPVNPTRLCRDDGEAVALARAFGYPVALKVRSELALHKSESGGVHLNIDGDEEVRRSFAVLRGLVRDDPRAGVTVQPMAAPGAELIVGVYRDAQFGPVLAFGPGGFFAELYRDVALRLLPLEAQVVRGLFTAIRGRKLLTGYRHLPPVDTGALERLILAVSALVEQTPALVEMDLNPVVAYREGVLVLDARAVLDDGGT
ncbi:MAG: acetate--CoA ligase family protein [Peptococcaceae bacterium]|jgi:acetyl-CoA synthetase (ADP-forming)|nr:acetate--CoA ligase family protein [Peptococcaceae bacterium]